MLYIENISFKRFFFFLRTGSIFISIQMARQRIQKSFKIKARWWAIAILVLVSCIQRNNPWDPINYNPTTNPTKLHQDSLTAASVQAHADLKSLMQQADSLKRLALSADTQFSLKTALADSVASQNNRIVLNNAGLRVKNAVLDTLKDMSCTSLKSLMDTLRAIDTLHFSINFIQAGALAQALYDAGDSIAIQFNTLFFPDTVIFAADLAGLKSATDKDIVYFQNLRKKQDSTNTVYDSIDASFANANKKLLAENAQILPFNTNVQIKYPCNLPLSSADTIIKSISLLKPGDTMFIAPGAFNVLLTVQGLRGTSFSHIVIMGDPQGGTVFTSTQNSIVSIDDTTRYVDFVNIHFSGGLSDGVSVRQFSGPILFQNCAFTNNPGNGLRILDSDIKIMNCRFSENDSNGVFIQNCHAIVKNVLIANNHKNGIFMAGYSLTNNEPDSLELSNATISDNDSDGVFQQGEFSYVSIDKSLVTFNKRIGIHRENQVSANAPLVLSATDLYMNTRQNLLSLPPFDSLQFSSQDPLYVNKANYNYSIGPGSAVPDSMGYQGQ
jgi:Right handed beta helix region